MVSGLSYTTFPWNMIHAGYIHIEGHMRTYLRAYVCGLPSISVAGFSALSALNLLLLLEDLHRLHTLMWVLKKTLDFLNYTDPIPEPLRLLSNWPERAGERRSMLEVTVI